jgi:hypothetical protein
MTSYQALGAYLAHACHQRQHAPLDHRRPTSYQNAAAGTGERLRAQSLRGNHIILPRHRKRVHIDILGVAGDTIKTLLDAERLDGKNHVRWDGTDRTGLLSPEPLVWVTFSIPAESGKPVAIRDLRGHLLFHTP